MFKKFRFPHPGPPLLCGLGRLLEQGSFPNRPYTLYMDADGRLLVDRAYPYERLQGSLERDVAQRLRQFQP